jgi:hypothetical protein
MISSYPTGEHKPLVTGMQDSFLSGCAGLLIEK